MNTALILFETEPAFREELSGILAGYKVIFNESNDTSKIDAQTAGNTSIIMGNPKADFLKLCTNLKWLQLESAGTNGFMNGEVKEMVQLTCASGCYGHAVSEHMVGLTFEIIKKLHLYRDGQFASKWQSRGPVKSILGAVVLVIGIGDIGSNYARRMKALGSYVIGLDLFDRKKPDYLDEFSLLSSMDNALKRADVVAVAVPGTNDTAGLIGRNQLALMKPGAVFINSCRGMVVDTEALCDALESGALGGAGLDVTEPEPLPPDHRLWKLENAVITPHVSGARHLRETGEYISRLCLRNAEKFLRNEPMESLVNFKTGFRFPAK